MNFLVCFNMHVTHSELPLPEVNVDQFFFISVFTLPDAINPVTDNTFITRFSKQSVVIDVITTVKLMMMTNIYHFRTVPVLSESIKL